MLFVASFLGVANCGDDDGAAAPTQLACAEGLTVCQGACADTSSDRLNCGACGTVCAAGSVCSQRQCVAACAGGETNCGGSCVVLASNAANCGSCGHRCAADQACSGGTCSGGGPACPSGQTLCGSSCVNLADDEGNCGACGRTCAADQACGGGTCSGRQCPIDETPCGSACTRLQTDYGNCGACGRRCGVGQRCYDGDCVTVCGEAGGPPTTCGPMACTYPGPYSCDSACIDLERDNLNCGNCGHACKFAVNGGRLSCIDGVCMGETRDCPIHATSCGGTCVYLETDPANCGACGRTCGTGQICWDGNCDDPCPDPARAWLCHGACVDLANDEASCGSCGTVCAASQTCSSGVCR